MKNLIQNLLVISLLFSCNSNIVLNTDSQTQAADLQIVQNILTPVDNLDLSANQMLSSTSLNSSSAYIRMIFTLSKYSGSPSVVIEGNYDEALSVDDIDNLASIGLTRALSGSTKGNIQGLSKNINSNIDLSFNIKINSSLYADPNFSNLLVTSPEVIIYVGGDNHIDGEYIARVKNENYYLFHEWINDDFSAVQLLPEGNYRRVDLGKTSDIRMDTFTFVSSVPEINGHQVGYSLNRNNPVSMYKVSNDGSGLKGWTHSLMSGLTLPYRLMPTDLSLNGEAVLIGKVRFSSYQNGSFAILSWDGSSWTETLLGNALKSRLGLSFTDNETGASEFVRASDGSYWMAISETSSGWSAWPVHRVAHTQNYFIRLEYISGDITDLDNWNYETVSIPDVNLLNSQQSNIQGIIFTSYTDKDNFTAYINGQGIAKIDRVNGNVAYTPISSHPDNSSYDLSLDFPTGRDANNLSQVTGCHALTIDIADPNKIFCMGYTSMFTIDTRNGDVEEVLGQIDNESNVVYSR